MIKQTPSRFGWKESKPAFKDHTEKLSSGGVFPENDKLFQRQSMVDEKDKYVVDIVCYRGYIVKQRSPYNHWHIFSAVDGSELPLSLQGSYVTKLALAAGIDRHLDLKIQLANSEGSE